MEKEKLRMQLKDNYASITKVHIKNLPSFSIKEVECLELN